MWGNSDQNFKNSFCFSSIFCILCNIEVSFGSQVEQSVLYQLTKESPKNHVLEKSMIKNTKDSMLGDPNYPMWGNSDHLSNLGRVIRIITAKTAIPYFPHLLTQFFVDFEK